MVHANYDGSFSMPGWTTDYEIGDLLSHISGREVGLNESASADAPQYMQVTGIEWGHSDDGGPVTRLIVDRGTKEYVDNAPRGRNAPAVIVESSDIDRMVDEKMRTWTPDTNGSGSLNGVLLPETARYIYRARIQGPR